MRRLACAAALLVAAARCFAQPPANDRCGAAPAGRAIAFFEGQSEREVSLHATVARITTKDGAMIYDLGPRRLNYRSDGPIPGVHENAAYDVVLEYLPGFPSASTLTISDERGILFVAVAAQNARDVAGFQFAMTDAGCASRPHNRCYDAIVNQKLRVTRGNHSVELMNNESASLDGYRVRVLAAQRVTYNRNCADAGLDGVAFTISREK